MKVKEKFRDTSWIFFCGMSIDDFEGIKIIASNNRGLNLNSLVVINTIAKKICIVLRILPFN